MDACSPFVKLYFERAEARTHFCTHPDQFQLIFLRFS